MIWKIGQISLNKIFEVMLFLLSLVNTLQLYLRPVCKIDSQELKAQKNYFILTYKLNKHKNAVVLLPPLNLYLCTIYSVGLLNFLRIFHFFLLVVRTPLLYIQELLPSGMFSTDVFRRC